MPSEAGALPGSGGSRRGPRGALRLLLSSLQPDWQEQGQALALLRWQAELEVWEAHALHVAHVQMLPHIAETPGSLCGYALSSPPLGVFMWPSLLCVCFQISFL